MKQYILVQINDLLHAVRIGAAGSPRAPRTTGDLRSAYKEGAAVGSSSKQASGTRKRESRAPGTVGCTDLCLRGTSVDQSRYNVGFGVSAAI